MGDIHLKSCESMSELADESVDLTVTSPPYWNSIDYQAHSADSGAFYRERHAIPYREYLHFLSRAFRETLRVHREGSFCAVIIGTVLMNGDHTPLPFHFVSLMEELGWVFHQDIIWHKCTAGVRRAGSVIQRRLPGYYYPNIMTEYILLFRKAGERRIYQGRPKDVSEASRLKIDSVFTKEIANNIWHIAPVPPGQVPHPCPFPEEIPYRLIRLYSYEGDLVLDPFTGAGTTLKVAEHLRRRWVGYEVERPYLEAAHALIKTPLRVRKQLVACWEKVGYGERLASTRPGGGYRRRVTKQLVEERRQLLLREGG